MRDEFEISKENTNKEQLNITFQTRESLGEYKTA